MESMCFSSLICDGKENEEDNRAEKIIRDNNVENLNSPVTNKEANSKNLKFIPYVEDDIPSYQIVRGTKRFSDMSEEQESFLPISPVITPPRIKKKENFQVPFVPTLGTIVKKNASFKVPLPENVHMIPSKESTNNCKSIYEILGMVDNDISWNSSMETPTHKLLPLGDYNTIERATLLPEKDLKNMQPRVLFSPHENDDSDCLPLRYSSESEDEKESNSTKLTSPAVCEINLKAKTLGSLKESSRVQSTVTNEKSPKMRVTSDSFIKNSALSPISPVFRISKKNPKNKKQKSLLVKSPDGGAESSVNSLNNENVSETNRNMICESDLNNEVTMTERKETDNEDNMCINDKSDAFQDDSFQNISFSCFQELCDTSEIISDSNLTCNANNIPLAEKEQADSGRNDSQKFSTEKNSSPMQEKITSNKFFYDSKKTDELVPVISVDDFLKSAKQFEECNVIATNKHDETFRESEFMVLGEMVSNEFSGEDQKIKKPVSKKSPDACQKKIDILNKPKMLLECTRNEEGRMEEELVKKQEDSIKVITTQSGTSDNQMFMATSCRERLADNSEKVNCCQSSFSSANEQTNNGQLINKYVEISENNETEAQTVFLTTSGKQIPPSNELDVFTQDFSTELDNKENNTWKNDFQGFKTASGIPVKISENSLSKAKKLFSDLDVNTVTANDNFPKHSGFKTASGMKVNISEEALKKAKNLFCDFDSIDFQENMEIVPEVTEEEVDEKDADFKTANNNSVISEESWRMADELWKQMEDLPMDKDPVLSQNFHPEGNILREETASLAKGADEGAPLIKPDAGFCGFSTASGKHLTVSKNALKKARKIFGEEIMNPEKQEVITEKAGSVNEACPKETAEVLNEKENNFIPEEGNLENSDVIPPWLHTYTTSPTITMEPIQFESGTSFEDCSLNSTPKRRYFINSPVLGRTDRFFSKEKRSWGKNSLVKSPKQHISYEDENKSDYARMKNPSIKRDSSELDVDFAIPFKKIKVEDIADVEIPSAKLSCEVMNGRKEARLKQVEAGKKLKVNPVKGFHVLRKKHKQMSWCQALRGAFPEVYSDETLRNCGVKNDVLRITAANASGYKFKAQDFFTASSCLSNINGFPVGDACVLIFDDNNTAGVEEFTRAFFASSGVEPNLISREWVKNHYKWLVWKFSHYERSFPHVFGGKCLTPHNVMVQLKYRYDREIDACERSALKKILEHDASSRNRIVLCVSDVKKRSDLCNVNSESSHNSIMSYVLELTDGWYSCCAQTDSEMSRLIEEGKVMIGTKLVTHGAELLGCDEGVSPLEVSDKVHLKIFTNSTRRVKWDTKLGFQKNGGPFLVSLNSILPNGGLVGRLDVVIVRIYPVLYMEKRPDGTHVVRNSKTEDRAASAYQEQQEAAIEKIYQQVKDEVRSKAKGKKLLEKVTVSDVSKITDAEELFRIYEGCSDPSSFQSLLTLEQSEILADYQLRMKQINNKELSDLVQEKIKIEKMNTRKVTQLLRVKIVDLRKSDYDNPILLTIWNLTEDVSQMLCEGKAISIFNTVPNNYRLHKPVQLNSTRYTRYKELTNLVEYPARTLTPLGELTPDYEPVFDEIDVVGIVVFIRETSYGSRLSQTIYLSDLEYNFLGLVFWGSCKSLGWENVLTVGSVVACSNLQWGNKRYFSDIPNVYVTDSSVFRENPKENFLKEGIKVLKSSLPEDMKNFIRKCEDEIIAKLEDQKLSNISKNTSYPYDSSNSLTSIIKPKYINGFKMKPNASSTPLKSKALGLDTSDQEPSPIQKRIEKLQMYGEPPPLSPLPLQNSDKCNKKFKPPFKSVVDSSAK